MRDEIKSLKEIKVWKLVAKNNVRKTVLKGYCVFKLKLGANGTPVRFKARLVIKDFMQEKGIDYDESYAAVTKATTLKLLMAIIVHQNFEAKQYDITIAFLYAKIHDHEIHVEQSRDCEKIADHVFLLQKAIYCLKQSPLLWFEELTNFLLSEGYAPLKQDSCIFQHRTDKLIIAVYVDDLIAISRSAKNIENAAHRIEERFKIRSLGDLSFYLGCKITRNREERKIYLVRDAYISQLLENHYMKDAKAAVAPMEVSNKLQQATDGYVQSPNIIEEYQPLISGLMWHAMQTRVDIAYATSQLAKYMNNPN